MNVEKNRVIGIDIGGTGTKIGVVDARGKILARDESIVTNAYSTFEEFINAMCGVIERLIKITDSKEKVRGLGFLCAPIAFWQEAVRPSTEG